MNYSTIKYCDIANGVGVRTSLFVSGCTHHCEGCFNQEAWAFDAGELFTAETAEKIRSACVPDYIAGLSLLGGEPMEPANQAALLPFIGEFRKQFPQKTVWCYSGYTYEELTGMTPSRCRCSQTDDLLEKIDVLVDGRFVAAEKDITLRFRGSRNQRLIDMNKTRAAGQIVLWADDPIFSTHTFG